MGSLVRVSITTQGSFPCLGALMLPSTGLNGIQSLPAPLHRPTITTKVAKVASRGKVGRRTFLQNLQVAA